MPRWSQLVAITSEMRPPERRRVVVPVHLTRLPVGAMVPAGLSHSPSWVPLPVQTCDLVPLGDLLFDRNPVVREGGKQHSGDLPGPLEQIGGHDLFQDGVFAPVMELLEVSADNGLVFICRHHGPPSARFLLKE